MLASSRDEMIEVVARAIARHETGKDWSWENDVVLAEEILVALADYSREQGPIGNG